MTKRIKKSEELIEPSEIHAIAVKELPAEDIDHYYSDLYLRKSPKSTELVNKLKYKDANVTTFRDNIDHDIWYELPFCYSPYWDKKESKKDLFKSIDECVRKANEAEGIYNLSAIMKAYRTQQKWYKDLGLGEDELAPQVMLFIVKDEEIKGTKLIDREDVYTYEPEDNEYYLDRVRDTGDIITDYNLEPAQKLVDSWNRKF